MENFVSSLSTGLPNLEWKRQLRENDMEYRKIINERRIVDDARRKVDEKTEQLKAIAEISTIIAGFTISSLCEIHISPTVSEGVLVIFGCVTSGTIGIEMICALLCTYLMVGLYRCDTSKGPATIDHFLRTRCEGDWRIAFHSFVLGVMFFALTLCAGSWVLYWNHPYGVVAASIVTFICLGSIAFWYIRVYLKWAPALEKGSSKIVNSRLSTGRVDMSPGGIPFVTGESIDIVEEYEDDEEEEEEFGGDNDDGDDRGNGRSVSSSGSFEGEGEEGGGAVSPAGQGGRDRRGSTSATEVHLDAGGYQRSSRLADMVFDRSK